MRFPILILLIITGIGADTSNDTSIGPPLNFCITREFVACHFTPNQNDNQVHDNNTKNFSKCEPHHNSLKMVLNTALREFLYKVYAHLLMDTMTIQWTIPMWQCLVWSLERQLAPFATITVLLLISSKQIT